mmetsp:Transcript_14216/g.35971  ORF Transcript_14216/g.35971 Transcript_14216/m.35971 type:complete len:215 (-) Transcript_14216:510-1154(-)
MGKRGLSADEKKAKLKELLQNAKEPFTLKQIEKMGAKAGVSQMAIKGQIEEMVSDNIVDMDKIGSTNWFWSFPSKEVNTLETKASKLHQELVAVRADVKRALERKRELEVERKPSEERKKLLARLAELTALKAQQAQALETLKENDPNKAVEIVKQIEVCKEAANRWTDNTWELLSYLRKKLGKNKKELMPMLGIKDDFDYVEYAPVKKRSKKK